VRLALHACCGPCLLEPFDALSAEHDVTVIYANPNIHPLAEYERRRDTLRAYADERGIEVVEVPYEPAAWIRAVAEVADAPGERCKRCFRLRLEQAARTARDRGCEALATTLTVSPYQDPASIREAGEAAAEEHGLTFLVTDFRDRYPEATRRSKELGMYRQNYCGCMLSDAEASAARRERDERKAAKRAATER